MRFSIVAAPIYVPTNGAQGFPFLHINWNLLFPVFLRITTVTGVRWYLIVAFICISLMISDVERLFMHLLAVDPALQIATFSPCPHMTERRERERLSLCLLLVLYLFYLFLKVFWMWTTFKVSIEFVTILLLSYVLIFWPRDTWTLRDEGKTIAISSPTRAWISTPALKGEVLTTGPPEKSLTYFIS